MSERNSDSKAGQKTRGQDGLGLALAVVGGFAAVSTLLALRGQESTNPLTLPVDALPLEGVTLPVVVRLEGTNVDEGRRILREADFEFIVADNMSDAANKVVAFPGPADWIGGYMQVRLTSTSGATFAGEVA